MRPFSRRAIVSLTTLLLLLTGSWVVGERMAAEYFRQQTARIADPKKVRKADPTGVSSMLREAI